MNNLEHAKILIEKAGGKPTIGRRRRRRSHSRSRLCLVWWKKSKIAQRPGRIGGAENDDELRTMEAVIRVATVPDADKVSMLNAIHVLLGSMT